MTKPEQIIAAMQAKLTAAGLTFRSDTANPYSFEDCPAVILDCGDEQPDPVVGSGFVYWNLAVTLWIVAMGATPKMAPEITRAAAMAALYADRTLGGTAIDICAGPVNRSIDPDNPALGIAECIFAIKYRTMEGVA